MSMKRRDNKKRILRDGETQCKDGKYRFTYYEHGSKRKIDSNPRNGKKNKSGSQKRNRLLKH